MTTKNVMPEIFCRHPLHNTEFATKPFSSQQIKFGHNRVISNPACSRRCEKSVKCTVNTALLLSLLPHFYNSAKADSSTAGKRVVRNDNEKCHARNLLSGIHFRAQTYPQNHFVLNKPNIEFAEPALFSGFPPTACGNDILGEPAIFSEESRFLPLYNVSWHSCRVFGACFVVATLSPHFST